jgi:hypothetical protein
LKPEGSAEWSDNMPGPYVIRDLALLQTLPGEDAVIADPGYGIQCVGLVKYYSDCGAARNWTEGKAVNGGDVARGTVIATFKDGKYPNNSTGNHACFFVEEQKDGSGILVLEQHVKPHPDRIQTRVLKYRGKPKDGFIAIDNGDCYSVAL